MKKYFNSGSVKRKSGIIFILIPAGLFLFNSLCAQITQPAPTRQSSIEAFSKGNYEQAYNGFNQLLLKYPKDPLYKYYSGACLVLMKRTPEYAMTLLQQALKGASVVRSLPPDARFYLGRAQQMSGKFTDAVESYATYTEEVGKKKAREQNVPAYIQESKDKKGMLAVVNEMLPAAGDSGVKSITTGPAGQSITGSEGIAAPRKENSVRKDLPADYENTLDEALKLQYKADSLNLLAEEQRKQIEKVPESERSSLKMKISQNEMLASSYQKSADTKYNQAQSKMNPQMAENQRKADSFPSPVIKEPETKTETGQKSENAVQKDTLKTTVSVSRKPPDVFSFFEILKGETAYPVDKIRINPEVPPGLIYRIQLAVFRNPVAPSFFKGITPVYGFRIAGSDKTGYYAGMFRRSADARKALQEVKEAGFRDAFIVALADSKPVSSDRAAQLENEWGNKPFTDLKLSEGLADTIPPALAFRVEVTRSLKQLKPDIVESLRTIAGNKGLDILHLTDGNIVYLIGKFITFESAAEYADLLIRNNYRDAKVVAWLGNKEVPVETAKQLFNDLK